MADEALGYRLVMDPATGEPVYVVQLADIVASADQERIAEVEAEVTRLRGEVGELTAHNGRLIRQLETAYGAAREAREKLAAENRPHTEGGG